MIWSSDKGLKIEKVMLKLKSFRRNEMELGENVMIRSHIDYESIDELDDEQNEIYILVVRLSFF